MKYLQDRRQERSGRRIEAMHLQLSRVTEEFALGLCAVSDRDGNLMASSMDPEQQNSAVSDALALFGTLQDEGRFGPYVAKHAQRTLAEQLGAQGFEVGASKDITVREFHASGKRLYLTTVGKPTTMREVGIYRAILGIRRIWRQTASAAA